MMYKRYYDGYGVSPQKNAYCGEIVVPEEDCKPDTNDCCECETEPETCESGGLSRVFDKFGIDDIILIGILLMVMKDSADDTMLIIILAVIFLSGIKDK